MFAELIGSREAAKLLGVNRGTVVRWAQDGRLDGARLAGTGPWLFRRDRVESLAVALDGVREVTGATRPYTRAAS